MKVHSEARVACACELRPFALLTVAVVTLAACATTAPRQRVSSTESKTESKTGSKQVLHEKASSEALEPLAPATPVPSPAETFWRDRQDLIDLPLTPDTAVWQWPEEHRYSLPNGLTTVVLRKPDETLVSVVLHVPAGDEAESPTTRGASSLLAGWLRAGSERSDGRPLELRVEELGATVTIESTQDAILIRCESTQPMFSGCVQLVADLAVAPALPSQALLAVRARVASQVREQLGSVSGRAGVHLANLVFGDNHPAGRALLPDDVGGLEEATIRKFWSTWFRPNLAHLIVAGNVDENDAKRAASASFGTWMRGPVPPRERPAKLPKPRGSRIVLVDEPSLAEATITFGQPVSVVRASERAALEALVFIFGGAGLGSRLALDVAAKGLITAGGAALVDSHDGLFLRTTLQTSPSRAWPALIAAAQQLKNLHDVGLTPAELAEAKARSAVLDPFALESAAGLAEAVARSEAKSVRELTGLAQAGAALTAASARSIGHLLAPESQTVVIVGPAAQIGPQLLSANVKFEQIAFDDPVSAQERASRQQLVQQTPAKQEGASQARALIIRALAAQGGAPAWRALRTLKVVKVGERREANGLVSVISTTYYARPDVVRVEQKASVGEAVARSVFVVTPSEVRGGDGKAALKPLPPQNVARLRSAVFEDVIFLLLNVLDAQPRLPMQLLPSWQDGDRLFPGVLLRVPSGQWLRLYFDPTTHLLARIRSADGSGGETEQRLDDWREVQGLKFPFKQISVGAGASQARIDQVDVNPSLPPSLFR